MADPIKKLYDHFSVDPRNKLGSIDQFRSNMADDAKRLRFYEHFSSNPANKFGSFEEFSEKLFPQKKSPSGTESGDGSSAPPSAPAAGQTSKEVGGGEFPVMEIDWGTGSVKQKKYPEIPVLKEAGTEGDTDFNVVLTVGADGSVKLKEPTRKDVVALERRRALESVRERRAGDYSADAVQRMEASMTPVEVASLKRKTPLEMALYDTDVTSKEYQAQVQALVSDQQELDMAVLALEEQIEDRFGSAAMEFHEQRVSEYEALYGEYKLAQSKGSPMPQSKLDRLNSLVQEIKAFQEDPLVVERQKMVGAMSANLDRFRQMESDEKYAGVRKMAADQREIQQLADRGGTSMVNTIVVNSLAKLASDIGSVTDVIEKSMGMDKEYGALDKVQDFLAGLSMDAQFMWPVPSQYSRQMVTSTAQWGDYQVDFDRDKIAAIRDKDGKVVDMELDAQQEEEVYSLDRETRFNMEAIPYQVASTAADMAVMIAGAGKLKRGLTMVGVGETAAARTGVAVATAGQMAGGLYEEGLGIFDGDETKAAQFAVIGGLSIGMASNLFGLEARMIGGKGFLQGAPKLNAPAAVGQLTPLQAGKQVLRSAIKEGLGEAVEESIIEESLLSLDALVLGGKRSVPEVEGLASNAAIGFAVGALFGGATTDMNRFRLSSLLAASEKPEVFRRELHRAIEAGTIQGDEEFIGEQVSRATRIKAKLDQLDPDISPDDRLGLVGLVDRQMSLESKIQDAKGNDALLAKYEPELKAVNDAIAGMVRPAQGQVQGPAQRPAAPEEAKGAELLPASQVRPVYGPGKVRYSDESGAEVEIEFGDDVDISSLRDSDMTAEIEVVDSSGKVSTARVMPGGRVELDDGSTITEAGNLSDGVTFESMGVKPLRPASRSFRVGERQFLNLYSDPAQAINYDEDGNVSSVSLTERTEKGDSTSDERRVLLSPVEVTGDEAAVIAEQILYSKIADNEGDFNRFLAEKGVQFAADQGEAGTDEGVPRTGTTARTGQPPGPPAIALPAGPAAGAEPAGQEAGADTQGGEAEMSEEEAKAVEAVNRVLMAGVPLVSPDDEADFISAVKVVAASGVQDIKEFAKKIGRSVAEIPERIFNNAKKEHDLTTNDLNVRDSINLFDSMIQFIADRDRYVKVAISKLKKAGISIPPDMDAYLQKELMNSKVAAKVAGIYEDILGARFGSPGAMKKNRGSMVGRMERDGITWDMFNDLLYALHAKERNARVRELTKKRTEAKMRQVEEAMFEEASKAAPDKAKMTRLQNKYIELQSEVPLEKGSGISDKDAQDMIDKAKSDGIWDKFMEYEKEFREKVIKRRVDEMFEAGLIKAEQRDALLNGSREGFSSTFEHYVPLYIKEENLESDVMTTTEGVISSKIYGLKGSEIGKDGRHRPADIAMVLLSQAIKSSEQNKVLNSLAKLVEANPLDGQWSVVPGRAFTKVNALGEVISADDRTDRAVKENGIQFKQDGKVKYLFVAPTKLDGKTITNPIITAFKRQPDLASPFWNTVLGIGRAYNTVMRTIITSIDPTFGIANAFRDIQEALANVTLPRNEQGASGIRRMILRQYPAALAAIAKSPWSEPGSKMADYWVEMKEAGVPMTWRNADNHAEQVEGLLEYLASTKPSAKGFARMVYERMTFINDTLENVTRLSVYAALREKGVDKDVAAGAAKNVTVNFEKKGQAGNVINAFYLFASPGIQGAYNTARLAADPEGRKVLAGVMLGGMMVRMMLYALMDDDDVQEYVFNDFKSSSYVFVPNPFDKKNPITIPKPYSLVRAVQGLGEGMVDMYMGNKTAVGVAGDFSLDVISVMDPFGGSNRSFAAFVPSMLQVPAELSLNRNWMGNKVYHFEEDPSKPDIFEANTSTIGEELPVPFTDVEFTEMARDLYELSPMLDFSPTTLEYVSKSYLTGIIKTAYNFEQAYQAMEANEDIDTRKIPLVSRFYQDVSDNKRQTLFNIYGMMEKSSLSENELEYLKKNLPEVKKFMSPQSFGKLKGVIERKFFVDKEKQFKEFEKQFKEKEERAGKVNIYK